jgi:hypothetical protein
MSATSITSTTDPITGSDVTNPKDRLSVVEGDEGTGLTVYFESESSRQAYLDIPVEHPEQGLPATLDNPTDDYCDAN